MSISRVPGPRLRPFVSLLWASDASSIGAGSIRRELVLPTGAAHIVLRLSGAPVRIPADLDDQSGGLTDYAIVGGPRATAYVKLIGEEGPSVGAVLRAGATRHVLGPSGRVLANRHVALADIWVASKVSILRDRIAAATCARVRLALFEEALALGLLDSLPVTSLLRHVQARLDTGAQVGDIVAGTGFSHRHVAAAFTDSVGLTPKLYQRVRRFNRALDALHRAPQAPFADLAVAFGYADQAHFTREFRDFAGISPGDYRRAAPVDPRHVAA